MLTTNTWHFAQHLKYLQLSHSPPRDLCPAPHTKQIERHRSNGLNMGPAGQLLWLVSCERMSLQSRQHLTRWCGEPHWAEVAGSPSSCLAAHQQHHCPTCGASWSVCATSVCAVALSPWGWLNVPPVLHERCGFCNLPSTWVLSTFSFHQLLSTSAGVLSLTQSNMVFYKVFHPLWAEIWQMLLEDFC